MTPRRMRLKRRQPRPVVLRYHGRLNAEMAAVMRRRWLDAVRSGVAIVDDSFEVIR